MRALFLFFLLSACGGPVCDDDCLAACDEDLDACVEAVTEDDDPTECTAAWEECIKR
jgi:hypothetical protein